VNFLDEKKLFVRRLYREDCRLVDGLLVKDLTAMNRDLKDVILLDVSLINIIQHAQNSEQSFMMQKPNGLLVKSFFHDDELDDELVRLIPFLRFLARVDDVRPVAELQRKFSSSTPFAIVNMSGTKEHWKN